MEPVPLDSRDGATPPRPDRRRADALFVLSGAQERKEFAAEIVREGWAGALVVSVGRFEWRRYGFLGLPGETALRAAVEAVPYRIRHFFVVVSAPGAREGAREVEVISVPPSPFGTHREMRALLPLAVARGWRSIVILSSAFHLPRTALVARRIFRGSGISLAYLAVPKERDRYGPGRWWRSLRRVRVIASEYVKRAFYALFLGR